MKKGFLGIGGEKENEAPAKTKEEIDAMTEEEKKKYDEEIAAVEKKANKKKEDEKIAAADKKKDEPKEEVKPIGKVGKGCFMKNIMHKGIIFNKGHKLDVKHPDFNLLKKHLN